MFKEIKGNHKKQAQKEKIMTNTETDLEKINPLETKI